MGLLQKIQAKTEEARAKEMAETLPVRIMIASADPDELRGISADVLSEVRRMRAKVLKPYRDRIDGRHQWLIVAAASPAWARKVFPQLPEDEAVRRLWDTILHCVYLDREEDPVEIWQAHSAASIHSSVFCKNHPARSPVMPPSCCTATW